MRNVIALKHDWKFTKRYGQPGAQSRNVSLPHSWNTPGSREAFRGLCRYETWFDRPDGERIWLEVGAASGVTHCYVNGIPCAQHKGSRDRFRADITGLVGETGNHLVIDMDDSASADAPACSGLTRGVNLIAVPAAHFDLAHHGDAGVWARSRPQGAHFLMQLQARIVNPAPGMLVQFTLLDADGREAGDACCPAVSNTAASIFACSPRLWDGVTDPYLYTVVARLLGNNAVLDEVRFTHGFRTFTFDAHRGFTLNGRPCPLRGVTLRADNAGSPAADITRIRESGANAVRLLPGFAPEMLDACDRAGLIVWADIPHACAGSRQPAAKEAAHRLLTALIWQHRNHPSIACWGIADNITAAGVKADMPACLAETDALVRRLDPDRPTALSHALSLDTGSPLHDAAGLLGLDAAFDRHHTAPEDIARHLDALHAAHPDRPVLLSALGCGGDICRHTDAPIIGDGSEEAQALYLGQMLGIIGDRPWLCGAFIHSIFDSAADPSGLITADRQIPKDAFYLCKAHWSDAPFAHLCGKRAVHSADAPIRAYANAPAVALLINGTPVAQQTGSRVFTFDAQRRKTGAYLAVTPIE